MGWKSTKDITRSEAINLIISRISSYNEMTNEQLEDLVESLGYGEDHNLSNYGYNFNVIDDSE